jgi:hypothetical protein
MSNLQTQTSELIAFDLLHRIVGNGHRAQRHAVMKASGAKKYVHVKNYETDPEGEHLPITDEEIHAHLLGQATYAVPLIGTDGLASAGLIEQDAGGIDMARRILAAAEACGVVMFAIVVKGSDGHDGCHAWALYDGRYDPKAIRAQLHQIALDAGASTNEIYPNNTNIRLPFGRHLRSNTRGRLALQSGETYDLDDGDQLSMGEATVLALPLNSAPPTFVKELKDVTPCNIQRKITPGRANLADVKARFNADHTWSELLSDKGGIEMRGGWVCNCGYKHAGSLQIAITSQDKIVSFSPNCSWAPHRDSGKALDKFGFYVDQWHAGDVVAALKTLNPIKPKTRIDNINSDPPARYTAEQRAAYNAARREKRHQETRQALDAIYSAACNLDMPDRAHALFAYLLDLAHTAGVLQVAPTNDQLVEALDMCKRYVIYAFRELEAAGLGKRTGGKGGLDRPNEAATWTFYRSPNLGCKPHQDAECNLVINTCDSILDSFACEARAADTLDEWEWCDDAHSAAELTALEQPAAPEPAETVLDVDEIDRWVKEIQAVADARRDERRDPQDVWEKHEALVWRESQPVVPQPRAVYEQAAQQREAERARIRAAWDAIGDNPRALGARLGKLRGRLKKYPQSRRALEWQIHELHDRLANLTPVSEAVEPPRSPARGIARLTPIEQQGVLYGIV